MFCRLEIMSIHNSFLCAIMLQLTEGLNWNVRRKETLLLQHDQFLLWPIIPAGYEVQAAIRFSAGISCICGPPNIL